MPIPSEPIAIEHLIAQRTGQDPVNVIVTLTAPTLLSVRPEAWNCAVRLDPLFTDLHDIQGQSSYQALCLAIATVQGLLQSWCESGGTLTLASGTPFRVEDMGFMLPQTHWDEDSM